MENAIRVPFTEEQYEALLAKTRAQRDSLLAALERLYRAHEMGLDLSQGSLPNEWNNARAAIAEARA